MAKRACLTVDDVVQQCADSDDDYAAFEYDLDEPVMEGSDDELMTWKEMSPKMTLTPPPVLQLPVAQVLPPLLGMTIQHGAPP